ncbi:putative FAD-binding dehydrogenase [Limihaloglobus sulfuriphilus]|uniref:Putative FAD-binding dehydrogenase n=1 Tax=Limihaloglobus sulfuriphilus TaxID=1851148 RepID=A0A1Q2MFP7_9BACT|nr:FAD-dependent oxidoreductase [Limihaloglobus sulfuriphilus]AQQ71521.1 putative FAD-binding dehydrogenase [Limihaloglobus sulfuriphilus]
MRSQLNLLNRRDIFKVLAVGAALGPCVTPGLAVSNTQTHENNSTSLPSVDVIVCGGGPSGIAAAIMAARQGRKTLLVERYGRLGGAAVQSMVGPLMGKVQSPWVDKILKYLGGRRVDYEFIDLKYAELLEDAGAGFLLHAPVVEPICENNRVNGIRILTKQGLVDLSAKVTVDATGDGDVAFGAGAEFDIGRGESSLWEADGLCQPMTIMFRVSGINHAETMEANGGRRDYRFPDGRSWNDLTQQACSRGELPPEVGFVRTYTAQRNEDRIINATQVNGLDGTDVSDLTKAELYCRRQTEPIIKFLKKKAPGFQNAYVSGMPAVIGVRETRRIRGLECLKMKDLLEGRKWDSAVVHGASFPIDIHNPSGAGQAIGYVLGNDPKVKPYDIPYGCLVPRKIDGLLTAGRCISGTHEAMASYRVQVIAMATGLAAGTAAALAAEDNILPRDVDVRKIQKIVF